jgi:hypothetical protein
VSLIADYSDRAGTRGIVGGWLAVTLNSSPTETDCKNSGVQISTRDKVVRRGYLAWLVWFDEVDDGQHII